MTVERDWFWFWFWFYYALWLASVFTLVLVLRQSSENRSILLFMFFSVEGLQKQLDVSLKELEGLKEARERQMQMVSIIM